MAITTTNWRTANSLTAFPLSKSFGVENFIIDANFVQFDAFVPVLQTVVVAEHSITLTILFDTGTQTATIQDTVAVGDEVKFYDGTRYLGRLLIGQGASTMWIKFTEQTLTLNIPFLSATVRAIPSASGVFSIGGAFGPVRFVSDDVISFDLSGNDVTCHAAALNAPVGEPVLKTINGVEPVANNITFIDTDIIKFGPDGEGIQVALIDPSLLGILLRSVTIVIGEPMLTEDGESLLTENGDILTT